MGKWEMVRLGDVCNLNMGQSPASSSYNENGEGLPFYQGNADFGELYPIIRYHCSAPKKTARPNDILLSVRAPIGALNIANEKCCIGRGLAALTPFKNLEMKYLYYILKDNHAELNAKGTGSTFKAINKSNLSDFKIPLPPLEIQQKIAATLDTAAALLKHRQQQLAELEALIQSVFYQMFGDPVRNEKGWEKELLKKMCTKLTDGTHFSPPNNVVGDYKYVTAKNIKQHGLDLSNISYISEADHKSIYSRCNPEKGDVLYIKDGATTGIAVVNTLSEEFSLLSSVALLKHDRRRIEGSFLKVILNNKNMKSKIREDMGGAAITRLTLTKISNIQIPVPPLPLQTQFAAIVQKIDQQKALVQQSIDETQTLFDSLMSQYFD